MASTNAFMKLLHDTGALISTYASEDLVGITMSEQLALYQVILPCIPFNYLGLCRFCRNNPSAR